MGFDWSNGTLGGELASNLNDNDYAKNLNNGQVSASLDHLFAAALQAATESLIVGTGTSFSFGYLSGMSFYKQLSDYYNFIYSPSHGGEIPFAVGANNVTTPDGSSVINLTSDESGQPATTAATVNANQDLTKLAETFADGSSLSETFASNDQGQPTTTETFEADGSATTFASSLNTDGSATLTAGGYSTLLDKGVNFGAFAESGGQWTNQDAAPGRSAFEVGEFSASSPTLVIDKDSNSTWAGIQTLVDSLGRPYERPVTIAVSGDTSEATSGSTLLLDGDADLQLIGGEDIVLAGEGADHVDLSGSDNAVVFPLARSAYEVTPTSNGDIEVDGPGSSFLSEPAEYVFSDTPAGTRLQPSDLLSVTGLSTQANASFNANPVPGGAVRLAATTGNLNDAIAFSLDPSDDNTFGYALTPDGTLTLSGVTVDPTAWNRDIAIASEQGYEWDPSLPGVLNGPSSAMPLSQIFAGTPFTVTVDATDTTTGASQVRTLVVPYVGDDTLGIEVNPTPASELINAGTDDSSGIKLADVEATGGLGPAANLSLATGNELGLRQGPQGTELWLDPGVDLAGAASPISDALVAFADGTSATEGFSQAIAPVPQGPVVDPTPLTLAQGGQDAGSVTWSDPLSGAYGPDQASLVPDASDDDAFSITAQGRLTLNDTAGADFITKFRYSLDVTVGDVAEPAISTTAQVLVDVLPPPPTILTSDLAVSNGSTSAGTLAWSDPTSGQAGPDTVSLVQGSLDDDDFTVSPDGTLTLDAAADYAAKDSYVVDATVANVADPGAAAQGLIDVHVLPPPPTISTTETTVLDQGTDAGVVAYADPTGGRAGPDSISLVPGADDDASFAVAQDGSLSLIGGPANFSQKPSYLIDATVSNEAFASVQSTSQVAVDVVPVPTGVELQPGEGTLVQGAQVTDTLSTEDSFSPDTFSYALGSASLPFWTLKGDTLASVPSEQFSYSDWERLLQGLPASSISDGVATGLAAQAIEAALAGTPYEADVTSTDAYGQAVTSALVMSVQNAPPTGFTFVPSQASGIDEYSGPGTVVGTVGQVVDPDPHATHKYAIVSDPTATGTAPGRFAIDPNTGVVTVVGSGPLPLGSLSLGVQVYGDDGIAMATPQAVTVPVYNLAPTNLLWNVPGDLPYLAGGSSSGAVVGTVDVVDDDPSGWNFQIPASNSPFAIDPATGVVTLKTGGASVLSISPTTGAVASVSGPGTISYLTTPLVAVTVQVTDSAGNVYSRPLDIHLTATPPSTFNVTMKPISQALTTNEVVGTLATVTDTDPKDEPALLVSSPSGNYVTKNNQIVYVGPNTYSFATSFLALVVNAAGQPSPIQLLTTDVTGDDYIDDAAFASALVRQGVVKNATNLSSLKTEMAALGLTITALPAGSDGMTFAPGTVSSAAGSDDIFRTSTSNPTITGTSAVDRELGLSSASNTFLGSALGDVLIGSGNDTVDYSKSPVGVAINLGSLITGTTATVAQPVNTNTYVNTDATGDILSGIENVIGSATLSNSFTGDANNNVFTGGSGNNYFTYSGGTDTDYGGTGATSSVPSQANRLYLGNVAAAPSGTTTATVDFGLGTAKTSLGTTTFTNINLVTGTPGDDVFKEGNSTEIVQGDGGNDTLLPGGTGTIDYSSGSGSVHVTASSGVFLANSPSFVLDFSQASSAITLSYDWDDLLGGGGAQGDDFNNSNFFSTPVTVTGSQYADSIFDPGPITLNGGGGNDNFSAFKGGDYAHVVTFGDGNHNYIGGLGPDTVTVGNGNSDVDLGLDPYLNEVTFGTGDNTLDFSHQYVSDGVEWDAPDGIYQYMSGSSSPTKLDYVINGTYSNIIGTYNADIIDAPANVTYVDGGGGADILRASDSDTTLKSEGVNPGTIGNSPSVAEPKLYGGAGNDTLIGSEFGGVLDGGGGTNLLDHDGEPLFAGMTRFEFDPQSYNDTVEGFKGSDTLDFVGLAISDLTISQLGGTMANPGPNTLITTDTGGQVDVLGAPITAFKNGAHLSFSSSHY